MNSSTSVIVSAREWAASLIIAEEWLIRPPTSLAIAIARLAAPARITVPVDSPSEPPEGLVAAPACASSTRAWRGARGGCVIHHPGPRRRGAPIPPYRGGPGGG